MLQFLSIERVVTFLTPFFAAGAAAFTGFIGSHVGVHLDAGAVAGVEISAFVGTAGIVAKWLHGRQIPEIAGIKITPAQIDQLHAEVETYLKAHGGQTEADAESLVDAVLEKLTNRLARQTAGIAPAPLSTGATQ